MSLDEYGAREGHAGRPALQMRTRVQSEMIVRGMGRSASCSACTERASSLLAQV